MLKLNHYTRIKTATAVAILFHAIGLIGLIYAHDRSFFIAATPMHLLLMSVLLIYTQKNINYSFFVAMSACMILGFGVEYVGVHTGWLFGEYSYGDHMGTKVMEIPLIIGVNWWMVISGAGNTMEKIWMAFSKKDADMTKVSSLWKNISWIVDGALLATFFDWVMEPVAMKLGYWQWNGLETPPLYNFLCWFLVSCLLLGITKKSKYDKDNLFGMHLLMIQLTYFSILRLYL